MSDPNAIMDPTAATAAPTPAPNGGALAGGNGQDPLVGSGGHDSLVAQKVHATHRGLSSEPAAPDAGVADAGASGHGKGHISHHEMEHEKNAKHDKGNAENRSAFSKAWDASKNKIITGAAMFAGFATLLGVSGTAAKWAADAVFSYALNTTAAGIAGAAIAGAIWMAGNEFIKVYKSAREDEDSRLNKAIDKLGHAKERAQEKAHQIEYGLAQDVAALGVAAGSIKSHVGTTALLVEAPEAALNASAPNQTVARILAEGPQSRTSALIEPREAQTAAQRLEQRSDALLEQAASL